MDALEISELYYELARNTKDLRWKREFLKIGALYALEWFK